MSKVDLTRNILTGVDKSILVKALANVEDLGLMQTELSKDQIDALLEQIVIKKNTKEVNLYEVNLKDVDKSLLARAISTIKVVVHIVASQRTRLLPC